MDEKEFGSIKGWFAGRLPDGWFTGVDVTIEDDQIVVVGALPDRDLPSGASAEDGIWLTRDMQEPPASNRFAH